MVLTWTTGPKGRRCPAWYFLVLLSPFLPFAQCVLFTSHSAHFLPRQNSATNWVYVYCTKRSPLRSCNKTEVPPLYAQWRLWCYRAILCQHRLSISAAAFLTGCFSCGLEVGTRNWDGGSKFGERKLADSPIGISLFLAKQNSVCVLQNVWWMYNRRLGSLLSMLKLMSHVGGYLREKAWIKFFLGSCDKKSDFKWTRRRRTGKRGRRRYKGESILKVFIPSSVVVGLHVDRISTKNLMHVFRTLLINSLVSINV